MNNIDLSKDFVTGAEIATLLKKKRSSDLIEKIPTYSKDYYLSQNWIVEKEFKASIKVKKAKSNDIKFEDSIWTIFAEMGFEFLNRARNFKLSYGDGLTQQIDVIAVDTESIVIVECKAADSGEPKKGDFKKDIEALGGNKEALIKAVKKLFPGSKQKIKFVFATYNYYLSSQDQERLKNFDIAHFDDDIVQYYQELTGHLGLAARFQMLGNLFSGQNVPEIENIIPAIQGKMGGKTYYSFSIEPEKLLKISYVLHRNKANKKLMPTYQRLIKKTRLKSVQNFVENKGFFPNSVIINIESKSPLKFDLAASKGINGISKLGLLHLPKKYRSVHIIDGQHRIYGYANSKYKSTNSIPVVAFLNMDRRTQLKIFMEINENQKAVAKNLRNTLNADLLWDSDNKKEQIKALKLQIAQDIGDDKDSPLFDRVIVGENTETVTRCISIEAIFKGLNRSNFFGKFSEIAIQELGTFYKGNNDQTYEALMPFLKGSFRYIKENLEIEWKKGKGDDGFIAINSGIESLIRIFSDIIDCLVVNKNINPRLLKTDELLSETKFYLDPLIQALQNLPLEERKTLKKRYGSGGPIPYWRMCQRAINESRSDFNPSGLKKYVEDTEKRFNDEAFKLIREIETFLKEDTRRLLNSFYGDRWFNRGVPLQVQNDASALANKKNSENDGTPVSPWDCLHIIDYRKIVTNGSNWRDVFEQRYTRLNEQKIRGGKEEKTKWMQKLEKIRNENHHSYCVTEDEYNFLSEINDWLQDLNSTEE